jgi:hypothetical protein
MGGHADVAQLVEHHLAKVGVAGSNPVVRSRSEAVSECEAFPAGDSLGDRNVSDADGFTVHEQARNLKFDDGVVSRARKASEELVDGDELFKDGSGWKYHRRREDRAHPDADRSYEEKVVDLETGEIIHEDESTLREHRDHGDARPRD